MIAAGQARHLVLLSEPGGGGAETLVGLAEGLGFRLTTSDRLHERLLAAAGIDAEDVRPMAWDLAARVSAHEDHRLELAGSLAEAFEQGDRVVVSGPLLPWFLGLHVALAHRVRARVSVITTVRHPAEAIAGLGGDPAARTAGWLNMILGTEHLTRDVPRSWVVHDDLLDGWQEALAVAEKESGAPLLSGATLAQVADIPDPVDAWGHSSPPDWSTPAVPPPLRDLAARTYAATVSLAGGAGDLSFVDSLRAEYAQMYP